jgi:hypothetical protein
MLGMWYQWSFIVIREIGKDLRDGLGGEGDRLEGKEKIRRWRWEEIEEILGR